MIGKTGIWSEAEAYAHAFSKSVAEYLADYFKDKHVPIIDLGCGKGTYLKYLWDKGFFNVCGFEGDILKNTDYYAIHKHDLSTPLPATHPVGNVLSIEVFEHIPRQFEAQFVENIVNCCSGKLVLSVAVEGQPGLGHVNCRNNNYIVNLFESKGFVFQIQRTQEIRAKVEPHVDYLRNTLMVFER